MARCVANQYAAALGVVGGRESHGRFRRPGAREAKPSAYPPPRDQSNCPGALTARDAESGVGQPAVDASHRNVAGARRPMSDARGGGAVATGSASGEAAHPTSSRTGPRRRCGQVRRRCRSGGLLAATGEAGGDALVQGREHAHSHWRARVGWPIKMPAKGLAESISALVNAFGAVTRPF